jgi:hypothetical protein
VAEEQIPLDPKKRDALFRKFAEYQKTLGPEGDNPSRFKPVRGALSGFVHMRNSDG